MLREDGTGAIEYFYGKMGEVTKTHRTLIVPNQAIATYVTQWTYDSHNRLLEMIYPDEEKITYSYNLGGQLEKVHGYKSYGYDYVSKIGYDKFEQRTYLKYCNGAETFYTYDPQRRTMARTTTTMWMARASAAMTVAWRLRRHELCRELQRITSKKATHTRRCRSTTIQTIWVAVVTSPILMARWCSISSMFLSVRFSLRSAITFGIHLIFSMRRNSMRRQDCITMERGIMSKSLWISTDPLQEKYFNNRL